RPTPVSVSRCCLIAIPLRVAVTTDPPDLPPPATSPTSSDSRRNPRLLDVGGVTSVRGGHARPSSSLTSPGSGEGCSPVPGRFSDHGSLLHSPEPIAARPESADTAGS